MTDRSMVDVTEMVLDILSQDPLGPSRRQAFVGLTAQDVSALRRLHPVLRSAWSAAMDRMLGHAARQPEIQAALGADRSTTSFRAELLDQVTDLTSGDYDEAWLAERIRMSLQTADAGVPADWIASAWSVALSEILPAVRGASAGPTPAGDDPAESALFAEGVRALLKVAFLDIGIMLHTRAHLDREAMSGLRQFARTVLESVPDGIVLTDAAGRIQSFNAAAERIFGIDRLAVSQMPFAELLHEANRAEEGSCAAGSSRPARAFGATPCGRAPPTQMTGLHADGATVPVEVTLPDRGPRWRAGLLCGRPGRQRARARPSTRCAAPKTNFRALIEGLAGRDSRATATATIVYANPGFLQAARGARPAEPHRPPGHRLPLRRRPEGAVSERSKTLPRWAASSSNTRSSPARGAVSCAARPRS
jgi:PAS domain S-box-containing protein